MGTHNRRIDKEGAGQGAGLPLAALPEPAPDTASFPAAKAVVYRVPVSKVLWQVTPRCSCPGEIEDGLDKQPITKRRRAAGA